MDIDWRDPQKILATLGRHVGLWFWDIESGRVQWSDHLLEMLGRSRGEFDETYDAVAALMHPDDVALMEDAIAAHLHNDAPYRFRCRLAHKDGSWVTTVTQGSTLRDTDGTAIALAGTVLDISNEVRVRTALADSELSFKALTEAIPGAVIRYVLNPDGSDHVEYISPACEAIWGVSAVNVRDDADALWSMVLPEDLPALRGSVEASASGLSFWHHRWRIRMASGQIKHLEGRGSPHRRPDGSLQWHKLVIDVTRDAEMQAELLEKEKMLGQAQKMESIGRIAGGIAHDFNNLLAIIMGNAQLLDEIDDPAEHKQFITEIVEASQRGSKLTRQLLSFARRSMLTPVVIDLHTAISEISGMLRRVIPERIAISFDHASDLWKTKLDVSFLENAVVNLCINARDAMPEGGVLSIKTENVVITPDHPERGGVDMAPGPYVLLSISDTGVGISPEDIPRVLEPFYSSKSPDRGSGLGLPMVEGFVRQSQGALRIHSEVIKGTTIKLYLPACSDDGTPLHDEDDIGVDLLPSDKAPPTIPQSSKTRNADVRARLLLVEDETAILSVLRLTLERAGYLIEIASSGTDALERFGAEIDTFDLVLSDVVMPGDVQGPDLARELIALKPDLHVILMSGYPDETTISKEMLPPQCRFLIKPVPRDMLLDAIAEALRT